MGLWATSLRLRRCLCPPSRPGRLRSPDRLRRPGPRSHPDQPCTNIHLGPPKGGRSLIALAESFRKAVRAEFGPERYPFTKATTLLREVGCNDEETLRRRIHRCRTAIQDLAAKAGDPPPPIDAVIENSPWHGYRLNPDWIRIVARSELGDAR